MVGRARLVHLVLSPLREKTSARGPSRDHTCLSIRQAFYVIHPALTLRAAVAITPFVVFTPFVSGSFHHKVVRKKGARSPVCTSVQRAER